MLANTGTCTYNGVTWTALYKSRITSKPIMDEARRTTVYVEHTLEVDGYLAEQSTDDTLEEMRQKLTAQGGALRYLDKGFGDLNVNAGGSKDSAWGPIPELLEWMPIGSLNAAKVKWRVTCRIPECESASFVGKPLAVNYEVEYDIDVNGITTIRTSGYLEIPMTRAAQGNRNLPDTADNYRHKIVPEIPLGYRRLRATYNISKDKRRLDFLFEDRELEGPTGLPDGVSDIQARESIESSNAVGFLKWQVTIEATITMDRLKPKWFALERFLLLVRARTLGFSQRGCLILPTNVRYDDDIFGASASFRVVLFVLGGQGNEMTPKRILSASGMWSPVPGTDYAQWRFSVSAHSADGRGGSKAKHVPNDDAIIDLCLGETTVIKSSGGSSTLVARQSIPEPPTDTGCPVPVLTALTPNNSWLYSVPNVRIREGKRMSVMKPLPTQPILEGSAVLQAFTTLQQAQQAVGNPLAFSSTPNAPSDVVQRPVSPDRTIELSGFAIRMGYRAPAPDLIGFAGLPTQETDREVDEQVIGSVSGVPVFMTRYRKDYIIPGEVQGNGVPYLPSPGTGTSGGVGTSSTLNTFGGGSSTLTAN